MKFKSFHKMIRINDKFDHKALLKVVDNIEFHFMHPLKVFKDDATSTVILIKVYGRPFVIKRSNTKSFVHLLRRALQKSRAQKNWENAFRLEKAGIEAVEAAAMLEQRWGPFKGKSYFISPFIEGIDALHYFALGAKPDASWPIVAKNIVSLLKQLALHRLSHRDMNLSNIILVNNQPHLLDLDAMNHYKTSWFAKRAAKKEKARFMKNWQLVPKVDETVAPLFQKLINL